MPFYPDTWSRPASPCPRSWSDSPRASRGSGTDRLPEPPQGPPFAQIAPYLSDKRLDEPVWVTVRGANQDRGDGQDRHGSVEVDPVRPRQATPGQHPALLLMGPSGGGLLQWPVPAVVDEIRVGEGSLDHHAVIGSEYRLGLGLRASPGRSASAGRRGSPPGAGSPAPSDCPWSCRGAGGGDRWPPSPVRDRQPLARRRVRRLAEIDQRRAGEHDEEPLRSAVPWGRRRSGAWRLGRCARVAAASARGRPGPRSESTGRALLLAPASIGDLEALFFGHRETSICSGGA